MKQRDKRVASAHETLNIIKEGFYKNQRGEFVEIDTAQKTAETHTELWEETQFDQIENTLIPNKEPIDTTQFEVVNETTLMGCRRMYEHYGEVFCLNFASAKNAGGGFLNGALAQEESLAQASGLYNCQIKNGHKYYEIHRGMRSCIYTDTMIYSPNVPVFKNDAGMLLDNFYPCTFLTSAAVNAGVVQAREPENVVKIKTEMHKRAAKVLKIALVKQHHYLVLGAWGCGVFRNNPADIAEIFSYHLLENPMFKNQFKHIVFSILDNKGQVIKPFQQAFS